MPTPAPPNSATGPDGGAGTLVDGEGETIKAIYQKRWKVETQDARLRLFALPLTNSNSSRLRNISY